MKRSEMVKLIAGVIGDPWIFVKPEEYAELVLAKIEEAGMLPPVNACRMVPDTYHGGEKHSESKREWDEEVQS